ncbi:hypothetical protein ACTD5D_34805 [Nocardia takedensis]|uniref:hypothetical protein n=1 Tax=Nocardia takedensis TaxID=259390 RepID=UPI000309C26D|nr:hypothetical protein [Nocardia takedensis]
MAPNEPARVFGEPYEIADGSTVVTAAQVHGAGTDAYAAIPMGVFVIRDGQVTWRSADPTSRVALAGVLVGLVAATIGTLTLLRRPPWPDLSARVMTAWSRDHRG